MQCLFPRPSPSTPLDVAQRRQQRPTASARVLALPMLDDGSQNRAQLALHASLVTRSATSEMANVDGVVHCASFAYLGVSLPIHPKLRVALNTQLADDALDVCSAPVGWQRRCKLHWWAARRL